MCSVEIFILASGGGVCGIGDGVVVDGGTVLDVDEMGRVKGPMRRALRMLVTRADISAFTACTCDVDGWAGVRREVCA